MLKLIITLDQTGQINKKKTWKRPEMDELKSGSKENTLIITSENIFEYSERYNSKKINLYILRSGVLLHPLLCELFSTITFPPFPHKSLFLLPLVLVWSLVLDKHCVCHSFIFLPTNMCWGKYLRLSRSRNIRRFLKEDRPL